MGQHFHIPYSTYLRAEIEAQIERLIALLDDLDGDADLEAPDEREIDDDFEPDADGEPCLGWVERLAQTRTTLNAFDDEVMG